MEPEEVVRALDDLESGIGAAAMVIGVVGMLASPVANADPSPCTASGGALVCQQAVYLTAPVYRLCDDFAPYLGRDEALCKAQGGEWVAPPSGAYCSGAGPIDNNNAGQVGDAFIALVHPNSCGGGPPPGSCTDMYCGCHTTTEFNLPIYTFNVMGYSGLTRGSDNSCGSPWAENLVLGATRTVGCPQGWMPSGDPDLPCAQVPLDRPGALEHRVRVLRRRAERRDERRGGGEQDHGRRHQEADRDGQPPAQVAAECPAPLLAGQGDAEVERRGAPADRHGAPIPAYR